ncbi:MAG: N-acetylmuramoyl-L-alanine amidase [Sphingomonadales bacterium CG12_big_fil_rev_8_21_14_0_65_65_10]|nr:MAG: N-acetylmuramoyl-L-alanine amidase [Sphingomonadales bacterium CG12_big_fil_rev_8_21_14_0_65_65_10]
MTRRVLLALIIAIPLGLLAGVAALAMRGSAGVRTSEPAGEYVVRLQLPDAGGEIGLPPVQGPQDSSRPLVVIDAGHGAGDPGAVGNDLREKDVTLAIALAVRDRLLAEGGIRVAMTRDDDSFLVLEERANIARRLGADLFVSIHADAAENDGATGATAYLLSEEGSSAQAEAFAERENRSVTVNGVQLSEQEDSINAILVDLSQRETEARSRELAELIVREAGDVPLRGRPVQSANFTVLRSPDLPSLLFEAGYISNEADAARLATGEGQRAIADLLARTIRIYFARQAAL